MPYLINRSSDGPLAFGPFILVPSQQLLLKANQPVEIGTRAFEILTCLVERAGEVVSKEDLIARVWPNVFVQEGNLKVHVATLRQALADGQGGNRFIVNVPGRGYRFVAAVSSGPSPGQLTGRAFAMTGVRSRPMSLTRMIGRAEIALAIADQISQRRFVSIVGPGGIGKTTIAYAIAISLNKLYRDGCRFLDLAPLSDARLVPSALAVLLGVAANHHDLIPTLIAALEHKQMLIVLDSCEHIIDAVSCFAEQLLTGAAGVHILATSREPLRAAGEMVRRLPPLDVPPLLNTLTASQALTYSAVELFVECTAARIHGFTLTDDDALTVANICHRLDGNPLAMELAAGRVDAFGVAGVAARLVDRFKFLTSGRRAASARHQTLVAMLDWSYDLLSEHEQTVLRQLSIFAGDFTIEAAEAVARDGPAIAADVVAAVADLTSKSLVSADVTGRKPRYRLLDTTVAYAREKLNQAGEFERTALRHAGYFTDLFDQAGIGTSQQSATQWRTIYAEHLDNVRAALDWAFSQSGYFAVGVSLTISTASLWLNLSLMDEYRQRVSRAISCLGAAGIATQKQEMQLFTAQGVALYSIGPGPESKAAWIKVGNLAEQLMNSDYQLRAQWGLWTVCVTGGNHLEGLAMAQKFMRFAESCRDSEGLRVGQRLIGTSYHFLGQQAIATHHLRGMLDRAGAPGNPADIARFQFDQSVTARAFLGKVLWLRGHCDTAMREVRRSVDDAESVSHSLSLCYALGQGACPVALLTGDIAAAEHYVASLLDQSRRHALALWATMGQCFEGILSLRRGKLQEGLKVLQTALENLREAGYTLYHTAALAEFSDALARTGEIERSLLTIDEALAQSNRNEERWCRAELLRVKAEILLRQECSSAEAAAEDHLLQSLESARECEAVAWELRAATSLCRLRFRQGRTAIGRELLFPVYAKFTEGLHTADLRNAKLLLES